MSNEASVTWRTTGRKLNEPVNPNPSIDVIEYPRSVSMSEGNDPYGIAIDAPLAVSMIAALQDKVATLPAESDFRKMMEGSFAITFDKNVLLKTISQPKCEGIRFYPCVKKGPDNEDVLSLVTVGVDADGNDLLYVYEEDTPVEDIPTRSLVSEYGYPPYRFEETTTSDLDPFVLFKFSQQL